MNEIPELNELLREQELLTNFSRLLRAKYEDYEDYESYHSLVGSPAPEGAKVGGEIDYDVVRFKSAMNVIFLFSDE